MTQIAVAHALEVVPMRRRQVLKGVERGDVVPEVHGFGPAALVPTLPPECCGHPVSLERWTLLVGSHHTDAIFRLFKRFELVRALQNIADSPSRAPTRPVGPRFEKPLKFTPLFRSLFEFARCPGLFEQRVVQIRPFHPVSTTLWCIPRTSHS